MMLWHKGTRIATTLFFAIASPSLTAGLPCKNEERVSCLLGFGAMVHTGTPGTAECQETCAILPSVENSKGCGSCKISTPENAVTYKPGNLIVNENGLLLSQGLTARVIATSKQTVAYVTGGVSSVNFHVKPDMGGTFEDPRPGNEGGWIYVSNSEFRPDETETNRKQGGVGAITFNSDGFVIDYRMILNGTEANCGGGATPWNTWVSGEEITDGQLWQVDPTGERDGKVVSSMASGIHRGRFESFAFDVNNPMLPYFYATKDDTSGELERFTPDNPDWTEPWSMLDGAGKLEYLVLKPNNNNLKPGGTFKWVDSIDEGRNSAGAYFPNSEGIDVNIATNELGFISKKSHSLFILQLHHGTYRVYSTKYGRFDGQPDQIRTMPDGVMYFTEDGGTIAGVHARNRNGQFFTLLEGPDYQNESTGVSFSPNGLHMYMAFQKDGILFDVSRTDGLTFKDKTLDVNYANLALRWNKQ